MTHIEAYVDCLKLLPGDLARDMQLIKWLDGKATAVNQTIKHLRQRIMQISNDPNSRAAEQVQSATSEQIAVQQSSSLANQTIDLANHPPLLQLLYELRQAELEAHNLSVEKINLTSVVRESIVSYSSRLDYEKRQFETEMGSELCKEAIDSLEKTNLRRQMSSSTKRPIPQPVRSDRLYNLSRDRERRDLQVHDEDMDFSFQISLSSQSSYDDFGSTAFDASGLPGSDMDDMDVGGPSGEEVYCFCRMPSFGHMVGCDSPTCKIEWFHYACVGLKKPPKGEWKCSDCRKKR